MRILIFHGYLLRGTGSNVYNAELARALTAAGHEVHLLCQDRAPADIDFVTAVGGWDSGQLSVQELDRTVPAGHGGCTVYRPPIADLLPVYVADHYDGFVAKTFDLLTDEELDFYVARNVMAVQDVAAQVELDDAFANHMVMGPLILARALGESVPYAAKIHGSAMEYTVRPNPRFLPAAIEGVGGASSMLVGSRHIAERAWQTLEIDGIRDRTFLAPPGVDLARFKPALRSAARDGLTELQERLGTMPRSGYGPAAQLATESLFERLRAAARTEGMMGYDDVASEIRALHESYETAGMDVAAPDSARWLGQAGEDPVALYVGKLIVSKGVDLLIAAWPLVRRRHPEAKLAIVGFGAYREGLEMLVSALSQGDLTTARWIAAGGRAFEGGPVDRLAHVLAFFDALDDDAREAYLTSATDMADSIRWFGRLDHEELASVIPAVNCQVIPSTFPEAFGMVAAEAAACGVPPISANHSGLAEVTEQLEENLSGASGALLSFDVNDHAVDRMASRISGVFGLGLDERRELAARLVATAAQRFSWASVATDVVNAASGRSEGLRRP
ncbi:MAG: glycosyltransferase [Solirubrobacterales bacterium]